MDADRFDSLIAALFSVPSRRDALRALGALGIVGLVNHAAARKKRKKKCARAGQKTSKKRKRCCKGLVKDASKRCCAPATCPPESCGSMPDGCGGTLSCGGCPQDQICLISNVCQPCTVTCTGVPTQCGTALQQALEAGGTIHVCPGTYQGTFAPSDPVTIVGAGEGDDPASNTILDANGAGRVLTISPGLSATLERLRIIRGNLSASASVDGGAGIRQDGGTLRLTECTVSGNTVVNTGPQLKAFGGGIYSGAGSTLELTRCTVRDNHISGAFSYGGGIASAGTTTLTDCLVEDNRANLADGGGLYFDGKTALAGNTRVRGNVAAHGGGIFHNDYTLTVAETCRVTRNATTSVPGSGGGIFNRGIVTLQGADPSPIVVNNCYDNCGSGAPVPKCAETPISCSP
jgi:hypothetical protein